MSVREDLDAALKQAMRDKNETALNAIRAIRSAVKLAEIDKKKVYEEAEIHAIIQSAIKQRRDSAAQFIQGSRADLAVNEEAQIEVLGRFLPAQLSEEQISALVAQAVASSGAQGPKDMGKVMGALMPQVKGKADGALVNTLVKKALGA
jgi:uncharacterized protein YqeY